LRGAVYIVQPESPLNRMIYVGWVQKYIGLMYGIDVYTASMTQY